MSDRGQTFILEVTEGCNNNCIHCYNIWRKAGRSREGEMSAAEIRDLILKLKNEVKIGTIGISGGEPFVRDDILEIASSIADEEIALLILTNGTMLTREKVEATYLYSSYEVPILSYKREVHNRLVRAEAFDKTIKGIANICHYGGSWYASFVATKLNYADLMKTAELAIAFGTRGFMFNRLNLSEANIRYADLLMPTVDMLKENLDTLCSLADKYELPISLGVPIPPCLIDIRDYPELHFGWCPAGREGSYYTIDPRGNLRICNHSAVILGNLREESFNELADKPYVHKFRDALPRYCQNCESEFRDECRGGCKAASEVCYHTIDEVDPFVKISLGR